MTETKATVFADCPPFFMAHDRVDGSLEIAFLTKNVGAATPAGKMPDDRINILPGRYEEFRTLADRMAGRVIVVTGRGPVEGYFAIGYYATLFGAEKVIYEGVGGMPRIEMPSPDAADSQKPWLNVSRQGEAFFATITASAKSDGKWDDGEVGCDSPVRLPATQLPVTFTGLGGVHMYLLLGVSAALCGLPDVRVSKPAIPYAVRFTPTRAGETVVLDSGKRGAVVGIIGDPNSGKSVFSRAFSMALRKSMPDGFQTWIYDCDLASPTPEWYCAVLVEADDRAAEDYKAIRDSQKVSWNEAMERRCANDLRALRTNLDMVIADLPGGRHPKIEKGETFIPDRIPGESRADMFRRCDAFIVLCRKDRHDEILNGWVDALAKFGLQDRVAAILDSSDPESEFSLPKLAPDGNGILYGEIHGLDRKKPAGETGQKLAGHIGPLVRAISATRKRIQGEENAIGTV